MNKENMEDFRNWLIYSRGYHKRSAGDLLSRKNRLDSVIAEADKLSIESIKLMLEIDYSNGKISRATLNSMLRAESLFREFTMN